MSFLLQSPTLLPFSPRTLPLKPPSLLRRPITSIHVSDQDLLKTLTSDSSSKQQQLPAVRSYETDLACLTLVGSVGFEQALAASAADGGDAAEEHLAKGMETMVVETVFPGSGDERSTVSTRLFLPAKRVKEKAKKLRSSLTADILSSGSVPKNILAMTFKQVHLQTLWSYKLSIFCPGTVRDMEYLANPREVMTNFAVSSSDKQFLSKLSEIVCSCVFESTTKFFPQTMGGLTLTSIFDWLQKRQRISLVHSSISIDRLSQDEMVKNVRDVMEKFNLVKGKSVYKGRKLNQSLLEPPNFSHLGKFGGSGFIEWAKEYVPAYKLQIDASTFNDTKLEGWHKLSNNRWEAVLTHFQMVELASILDMYYEDKYTLPNKVLSCGMITESPVISNKKNSLWKLLFVSIGGGCILIFVSILAQIYWASRLKTGKVSDENSIPPLSEVERSTSHVKFLETAKVEPFCTLVIQNIKDELGWPGDVLCDKKIGAWTGILPSYLEEQDIVLNPMCGEGKSVGVDSQCHVKLDTSVPASGADCLKIPTAAQDIASYQVVMSGDGKIVGFQPTSRVAVNQWASNPLTKLLYGGREISPGLLEPSLKIPRPSEVVLVELLMSVKAESRFALARPMQ